MKKKNVTYIAFMVLIVVAKQPLTSQVSGRLSINHRTKTLGVISHHNLDYKNRSKSTEKETNQNTLL